MEKNNEQYKFNDFGVCSNPKVAFSVKSGRASAEVRVAQSPSGRWSRGYSVFFPTHGYGGPVPKVNNRQGFKTEQEAVDDGIESILEYISRNDGKAERIVRDLVEKERPGRRVVQLELF